MLAHPDRRQLLGVREFLLEIAHFATLGRTAKRPVVHDLVNVDERRESLLRAKEVSFSDEGSDFLVELLQVLLALRALERGVVQVSQAAFLVLGAHLFLVSDVL